jgi:type IV secretion system protein VirD4
VTSGLLVKYLSLGDVTPHLSLPFELAKFGAKKEKGFGVIALVASIGLRQIFTADPNNVLLELNFFGD